MGFLSRVKDFLVRWDLMPILYPRREGGWIVPAIMGASALIKGIAGKKKADSANEANLAAQQAQRDWLQARQSGIDQIMGKLQQTGWNPFGVNELGSSQYGTEESTTRERFNEFVRQLEDPRHTAGLGKLNEQIFGRIGQPTVTEGEKLRQIAATNAAYQNALQGAQDVAGMRGAGALQRAAGTMGVSAQRAGDIADYLASVPELERKRQFENEAAAQGLIEMMKGQQRSGTRVSNTSGISNMMGSRQVGPDTGFLMSTLPPEPMAPMKTGNSPWAGFLGDIAGGAANIASYYANNQDSGQSPLSNLYSQPSGGFNWQPVQYKLGQAPR